MCPEQSSNEYSIFYSLVLKILFPYYSAPPRSRFTDFFNSEAVQEGNKKTYKKSMSIDLERIKIGKDKRTTVMIKNIPLYLTRKGFFEKYNIKSFINYCYMPFNDKTGKILGFAFLNVSKYFYIIDIYNIIKSRNLRERGSDGSQHKHCEMIYANVQGLKNLIKTFGKTVFKTYN